MIGVAGSAMAALAGMLSMRGYRVTGSDNQLYEPTASLDPRYQLDVMKCLRAVADTGVLVMVVTHDLGLAARFSDTVLVLSEGRLVAQGSPAQALSERVMADVFRISAYRAEYQREAVIVPWAEI